MTLSTHTSTATTRQQKLIYTSSNCFCLQHKKQKNQQVCMRLMNAQQILRMHVCIVST